MFNEGFMDAMAVGEEIYQCDIVGGEPVLERLNPLKVRIFKSGYSNRKKMLILLFLKITGVQGELLILIMMSLQLRTLSILKLYQTI